MNHDPTEKAYSLIEQYLRCIYKPTVFELGMCDGTHTRMLLKWCDDPLYVGFEPDPRNVNIINYTGLSRNIIFYPAAMGNVTGIVDFHLATPDGAGGIGCSSISEFTPVLTQEWPWLKQMGTTRVDCYRMDDFCHKHNVQHIDFLWMDVQGAERLVFNGAPNMISNIGLIWTEYDGGTLYADSSSLADIQAQIPGWDVLADCGGDVLLWNPAYPIPRGKPVNKVAADLQKS